MNKEFLSNQQAFDALFVGGVDYGGIGEVALSFGCFFGEDVTLVGVFTLYFSGAGEVEALFGAGVGFDFGHGIVFLIIFF